MFTGDKCWPFNLPQFTASSIFIWDYWSLKCCINGRISIVLWIHRTVHSRFFFPLSCREVILMWMCCYSGPFCSNRGTWKSVHLTQHVLAGLYYVFSYHCLIASTDQGDITIGTKSILGVQPFWRMDFCPVVQMGVLSEMQRCKLFGLFSCLLTLCVVIYSV